MARVGQRTAVAGGQLADSVSVGVLEKAFSRALVDEVIDACGRREQRVRALPARVMAYFCLGLALWSDGSYEDVLGMVSSGLVWAQGGDGPPQMASKVALFKARVRLGPEPLEMLFRRGAVPIGKPDWDDCFLGGRRLLAIDGTTMDVPDTTANDEHFGRAGVSKGERSAFPLARLVAVAECGTHAILDAEIGPYTTSEVGLSKGLVDRFTPGSLVIADRGFYGYDLWVRAAATGADLLWRVKKNLKPVFVEDLGDGSWLGEIRRGGRAGRKANPVRVRVIDYTVDNGTLDTDGDDNTDGGFRLITTVLDPADIDAGDLAAAYWQRWEIETVFDELKTHQRGARGVLRSKSPELIHQELWAMLCCHYAIRLMMADVEVNGGRDPDRVSFVAALRIARDTARQGGFSP
jgi:hypothetical protein